jgi:hypothetical protein
MPVIERAVRVTMDQPIISDKGAQVIADAILAGFERLAGSFGAGDTAVGSENVSIALAQGFKSLAEAFSGIGDVMGDIEQHTQATATSTNGIAADTALNTLDNHDERERRAMRDRNI